MIQIAVVNESTVVSNSDVPAVVAALQTQVDSHFAPAWGVEAELTFFANGVMPPAGAWQLVILDDSDQADALGYHDVTSVGLPLGKVFAKTTIADGGAWTVTASHELLEMLADPEINLTVLVQGPRRQGRLYAYEVCDAVENATYKIGDVQVSDFVLPSYFVEPTSDGVTAPPPYDYLGHLTSPLPALLPGGYLGVLPVVERGDWTQITDMRLLSARMRPSKGSRRLRRMKPRSEWRRSTR